jgi:hypothetical protein
MNQMMFDTGYSAISIGGILSSLQKKGFAEFIDGYEYSLGCNCWIITKNWK